MSKPLLVERKTYTVVEISEILGINKSAVYRLIKNNYFKSFKFGKSYRISKESFDNWFYDIK